MHEPPETWGDVARALAVGLLLGCAMIAITYAVAGTMP